MNQTCLKFVVVLLTALCLCSCSEPTPYDHLPHNVRPIIEKAILQSGGLAEWKNAPGYQFNKRSITYAEDGSIESKQSEIIQIIDHPELSGSIIWNNRTDTVSTQIIYKEDDAVKYIDTIAQDAEVNEAARLSFLEMRRTMSLPFNLLEQGVRLSYGGEQTQFGTLVKVILSENVAPHSEPHRWWHYFDANSYAYLGHKVYDPPIYNLVENLETTSLNGITYPVDRISWRVDSLDNKQYIQSKVAFSDFKKIGRINEH